MRGGASIPLYDSTRSFRDSWSAEGLTREKDYEFALWELLLKDPLVELRLLATAFDWHGKRYLRDCLGEKRAGTENPNHRCGIGWWAGVCIVISGRQTRLNGNGEHHG